MLHQRMQKGLSVLIVCLCLSPRYSTKATAKPTLRHVHGFQGIEVRGGIALQVFLLGVDYSYYLNRNWYFKVGLGGEMDEDEDERTSFFSVFTQPVIAYSLWDLHDQLYINLLAGTIITYQTLAKSSQRKALTSWSVGAVAGPALEFFITKHTALIAHILPRILFLGAHEHCFDVALEIGCKLIF